MSYAQAGSFVADITSYYDGSAPPALIDTIALFHEIIENVSNWHNDTSAYDWLKYFIEIKINTFDTIYPLKPLSDPIKISSLIDDIGRRFSTSSLRLNQNATFKHMNAKQVIDDTGALQSIVSI